MPHEQRKQSPASAPPSKGRRLGLYLWLAVTVVGFAVSLIPYDVEEHLGLLLLFKLRGPRTPPPEVAIVAMNQASAHTLDLPDNYDRWPRRLHARLIRNLHAAGARVIAFDVIFSRNDLQSDEDNALLAEAIRESGNVVVGAAMDTLPLAGGGTQVIRRPPIPEIENAAAAVVPFPLPPQSVPVTSFWTFVRNVGDLPTQSSAVLYFFAQSAFKDVIKLAEDLEPGVTAEMNTDQGAADNSLKRFERTTHFFRQQPELVRRMLHGLPKSSDQPAAAERLRLMRALIGFFSLREDGQYLNFYGPQCSLPCVSFADVVNADPDDPARWRNLVAAVTGKAVFVGAVETTLEDQKNSADAFDTVFSQANGLRLQGVEIGATAFANLLESGVVVRTPLAGRLIALFGASVLVLVVWWREFGLASGFITIMLTVTGCCVSSYLVFKNHFLWLPTIVPSLQLLVGTVLVLLTKHVELWAQHVHLRNERTTLVRQFSRAIPRGMVDEFVRSGRIHWKGYAVCLSSDIAGFTRLATRVPGSELARLLNEYFSLVFERVAANNGCLIDTAGDGMVALWMEQNAFDARRYSACRGALDIAGTVDHFNAKRNAYKLSTRIGLHGGDLVIQSIGNTEQSRIKPFGSAVSTASRIENLNKALGTKILVSKDVITGLNDFLVRPVGCFFLEGINERIQIFELMGMKADAPDRQLWLRDRFSDALSAYQRKDLATAEKILNDILVRCPDDGPSDFYLPYLRSQMWDPRVSPCIRIEKFGAAGHMQRASN